MNGIVIKQANTPTGDRIVWIFTDEYGIIKASGKGALKLRGKTGAGSQLLTYAEFEVFPGKNMCTISRAEPKDDFSGISESITKLALASYFCEAVYRHLGMDSPDIRVYRLLLNCIYALSYKDIAEETVKAVFEARLVCEIGYMPTLSCCNNCGAVEKSYKFSNESGGIVCEGCSDRRCGTIYPSAIAAWNYISDCPTEKLFSFSADDECIKNLGQFSESYLLYHTDIKLSSLEYYKTVK